MLTCFLLISLVLAQDSEFSEGEKEEEIPESATGGQWSEPVKSESASANVDSDSDSPSEEVLHRLEAASFYKIGLELVSEGRFDEAEILFESIRTTYSDTDLMPRVSAQLEALALL